MYSQERHTDTGQSILNMQTPASLEHQCVSLRRSGGLSPHGAGNLRAGAAQGEAPQCRQFSELRTALRTLPPQDRRATLIRTFLLRDFEGDDVSKTHAHI